MLAKDIMTTQVVTIEPETTLKEAINLLVKIEISGLMVMKDDSELVGVISEKDLLVAYDFLGQVKTPVSDFVNREVISIEEDTPVEEISRLLVQQNIRRVPVVKDKKLVGIVSRRDLLKCILLEEKKLSES